MFNKVASTFIIKAIVAFVNLAIVILLSRIIGAEGKGEASLILTSIALLLLFSNLVGGSALIYFIPRYNAFLLFVLSNLWSVIVCAIAFFIFDSVDFIPKEFVVPVVILSLLNSFLSTNTNILLGKEEINKCNFIFLIQAVANIFVLWLLLVNFHQEDVFAYINSLYFAFGLCLIISTFYILKYLIVLSFEKAKKIIFELFKLGFASQLGHVLKFMSFRLVYYIIVEYSSEAELGIFSNGNSLTEAILLITNSYATVLHPRISNSSDKVYSCQLTIRYTRQSIILCTLALFTLIIIPETFWLWLLGNEFEGLQKIILLLCPGIFFYNIGLIIGHYFSGIGKPHISTIGNFFGLLTTSILILIILPKFTLLEISLISSASYFMTTFVIVLFFIKETKTSFINLFPSFDDIKDLKSNLFLLIKK